VKMPTILVENGRFLVDPDHPPVAHICQGNPTVSSLFGSKHIRRIGHRHPRIRTKYRNPTDYMISPDDNGSGQSATGAMEESPSYSTIEGNQFYDWSTRGSSSSYVMDNIEQIGNLKKN